MKTMFETLETEVKGLMEKNKDESLTIRRENNFQTTKKLRKRGNFKNFCYSSEEFATRIR